jgi:hypothetical protein
MFDEKIYDVLVVVAEKDYNKLDFLIKSLENLIPQPENICIVSPTDVVKKHKKCLYYLDDDVLKIDKSKIDYRPNWIYQQFIKLLQNITPNSNYLVIDSDIFLNKQINVFSNDKPNFFITVNQYHQPYFNFLSHFGINKLTNVSFISEIMMFNKDKIREFLNFIGHDSNSFLSKSIELIDKDCYISEFEFYGNMILTKYPNSYNFKNIKTKVFGKQSIWDNDEISNIINMNKDLDIISYHTWT